MSYNVKFIKEFVKGSSILAISNIALKAIQFLLLPIYTEFLSPSELGIADSVTSFTAFLFPLLVMAFDSAFSAFYYEKEEDQWKKVFHTCLAFLMLQSLIPIIMSFFGGQISLLLFQTKKYGTGISLALISVSANLCFLPFALLTRLRCRFRLFALINMISSTLMMGLNILFVVVFKWGAVALMASLFIVNVLQLIMYLAIYRLTPDRQFVNKALFKRMAVYALPFIPMTLSTWILNMSDRYMLLYFSGEASVGIYGIGARFLAVISVIVAGINTAYTSFAFQSAQEEDGKKMLSDMVGIVFVLLAGICTTVSLFNKEVIGLMTAPEYHSAHLVLTDLMFSQLAYALYVLTGYGIAFTKKSKFFFYGVTAGAVVNVLLNLILIPKMGAQGAAFTTLVGNLVMLICVYRFAQRLYPCDYGITKIALSFAGLYAACRIFENFGVFVKIIVWAACAAVVLFAFRHKISRFFIMMRTNNRS